MTRRYLETHDDDVRRFANVIEQRLADSVDIDDLIADNERILAECRKHNLPFCLIDDDYEEARDGISLTNYRMKKAL
ncbi:hypothetical protein VJ923_03520 [Adlercreutzia sp. R25]|uniref:hypothetical protein n=1 Tax=Adlercreutzia shanghongiae TaxID=3111773 RepID=UPI002DBA640F|nr:hypothetical protein [Adlercreutzia sp. R25]MEC4272228.1 hypothetical protein [Adlercreutzia sp. R25]